MGNVLGVSEAVKKKYEADLKLWEDTIKVIEEHELQEWRKVTPGPCRLAVYWVQMLLCLAEAYPRAGFHALAWVLVLPFYLLERIVFACVAHAEAAPPPPKPSAASGTSEALATVAAAGVPRARRSADGFVGPAQRQMAHHWFWGYAYFVHLPRIVLYNLLHPSTPFFADGVDVTVYRPVKPTAPDADCCEGCCMTAVASCQQCCATAQMITIRYFRSSFLALSGYHALQCGTCCGPCIRPLCYDPCVGGDIESGRCACCEVDEIRVMRWTREAHEAKAARSAAFYERHPSLVRPPDGLLAVLPAAKAAQADATRPALVGMPQQ